MLDRLQRAWSALSNGQTEPYRSHAALPKAFANALQRCVTAITEQLAPSTPPRSHGELLRFYFDALQFARLLEVFDAHSLFDVSAGRPARSRAVPAQRRAGAVPAAALRRRAHGDACSPRR